MVQKLVSFTKKVADLADKPALNPSELKAQFDAAPEELRLKLNELIDALEPLAKKQQEAWKDIALLDGWTNTGGGFTTAQYMKDEFGIVHVKGVIQNGNTAKSSWVCQLPEGYRPQGTLIFTTMTALGDSYSGDATLILDNSGILMIWANVQSGQLSLNVPPFKAV